MGIILAIILTTAGVLSPIFLAVLVADYCEHRSMMKAYPVLQFKSFLSFYDLNPDRWRLNWSSVECKVLNHKTTEYHNFCFNYIDTKRYERWLKNLQNHKQSQSNAKQTAIMLAAVKEDIASIEALSKQEQSEAINILRSIQNI